MNRSMARASMSLDDLVQQLRQVHGDALRAAVLYGSAASGEQVVGHSDFNVLVIVSSIDVAQMRSLGQTMRAWQEAGRRSPLPTYDSGDDPRDQAAHYSGIEQNSSRKASPF